MIRLEEIQNSEVPLRLAWDGEGPNNQSTHLFPPHSDFTFQTTLVMVNPTLQIGYNNPMGGGEEYLTIVQRTFECEGLDKENKIERMCLPTGEAPGRVRELLPKKGIDICEE
ncbi:hypothetical protein PIB30_028213 [Stylosanthes scabra]|uniref:Uncharacterized protein n=1 Tax=Stylosanthes scabra TaxID=79078 RepID=A0ABU6TBM3_9FABA|nr:hypothetical protein [Stylosanthes scabra]